MDRKRHKVENNLKDMLNDISNLMLKNNARINGVLEVLEFVFTVPIIGNILQSKYLDGVKAYHDEMEKETQRAKEHFIKRQKEFDEKMVDLAMEATWPEETSDDDSGVH